MTKEIDISAQYGANRMTQLLNKLYLGDLEYLDEYSECVKEYLQGCYDEYIETIKEKEQMTNKSKTKFSAGDKVVALKDFHTIKFGDILTVENPDEYWFQAAECRGYTLNVANYELYKPQFKNMKFRVSSPEHSKEIQEALFEMGFCWRSHGCEVRFADSFPPCDYLYTDTDGHLWRIDSEEDYLASSFLSAQEHVAETTKSYKLIPIETPKEIITIDGKTYDKEAVLKRLAELEVISK